MTSAQHDIDHLEFPDGAHVSVSGTSRRGRAPPHIWAEVLTGLERCTRCHVRRFQLCGETVYQRERVNSLVAGAEPRCRRGGAISP